MSKIPIWREALKNSDHPMYKVAWSIFRNKDISEKIGKRFEPQKDEILPFLYTILDEKTLEEDRSLGSGYAPSNALRLLGYWQIVDAIPILIDYIRDDEYDMTMMSDSASYALEIMPPEAIDPLLEFGRDPKHTVNATIFLSRVGRGDDRVFNFIRDALNNPKNTEFDVITIAEMLVANDVDRAETYFREHTKSGHLKKYYKDFMEIAETERKFRT